MMGRNVENVGRDGRRFALEPAQNLVDQRSGRRLIVAALIKNIEKFLNQPTLSTRETLQLAVFLL